MFKMLTTGPGRTADGESPVTAEEIAKNVANLKSRMKGRGRGTPSPTPSPRKSNAAAKLMRKWGDSAVSAEDMAALDYSTPAEERQDEPNGHATPIDMESLVSTTAMGKRTKLGYEVADWDFKKGDDDLPTEEEILARRTSKMTIAEEKTESGWGNMFARLTGKKVLTQEDLRPVLADMEKHLMDKNVAKDIAEKMCESVGSALVGKKLGGLTSKFRNLAQDPG